MPDAGAPALLHIVGYLTGASLYAMLLVMVATVRATGYRVTLATAAFGLCWNIGELAAHALDSGGLPAAAAWVAAVSYASLGLLAAVTVHAAILNPQDDGQGPEPRVRLVVLAAYGCALLAAGLQLWSAAVGDVLPSSRGLTLLTAGLGLLAPALLVMTRTQAQGRRAVWMTGLALVAVSALHLRDVHAGTEAWPVELLGHQASIPLAFAILYQDFRFAFADLFLKRALTLLALVTVVISAWSWMAPSLEPSAMPSPGVGVLLTAWLATALLFPWLQQGISAFVDRVILRRADYAVLLDAWVRAVDTCASEDDVMRRLCVTLEPALSARAVRWRDDTDGRRGTGEFVVPVAEEPGYVVTIGPMGGGRRLLSDDCVMVERAATLAGRRIDALRLAEERHARELQKREVTALVAQAELRALRAQINPHFLFNTLTTIGYLIQTAPPKAVDTLMRLTTLLRSVLKSENERTTLGHECELVTCYLEIERARFEERLDVIIDVSDALAPLEIPGLILQPLVENAIKHGIAGSRLGGRVGVHARLEFSASGRANLLVRVTNTGAPLSSGQATAGHGIGLKNVEDRLRCHYGADGSLTLGLSAAGETLAELRIPVTVPQELAESLAHRSLA